MRVLAAVLLLTTLLTGCAAYTKAIYGDGPAFEDYTACLKEAGAYSMVPDLGASQHLALLGCMKDRGWERLPGQVPEGPGAYRRIGG